MLFPSLFGHTVPLLALVSHLSKCLYNESFKPTLFWEYKKVLVTVMLGQEEWGGCPRETRDTGSSHHYPVPLFMASSLLQEIRPVSFRWLFASELTPWRSLSIHRILTPSELGQLARSPALPSHVASAYTSTLFGWLHLSNCLMWYLKASMSFPLCLEYMTLSLISFYIHLNGHKV